MLYYNVMYNDIIICANENKCKCCVWASETPEGAQECGVIAASFPLPGLWVIGLIMPLIAPLQDWHREFSFDRKSVAVCVLLEYTQTSLSPLW